jgi:TetR/AcrR family transcriptional repressor of nem operon
MGNLASELSEVHEGFRQRLADVFAHWRSTLAGVIADGQKRQQIRPEVDPSSAAQFVVASLEGAILLAKLTRDIGVLERCVHELKEHLRLYANP